jgi:hypothetical protein
MLWFTKRVERNPKAPETTQIAVNASATPMERPLFAQPVPTAEPGKFQLKQPADAHAPNTIEDLNRQHKLGTIPFPAPRGLPEPILKLSAALGTDDDKLTKRLLTNAQLVFHVVGDTGGHVPQSQRLVVDKMLHDFNDETEKDRPSFCFHLGDVIYSFGEAKYYYDQFYEPYRDYPAPVIAIPGNHDGMIPPESGAATLTAFLENFCSHEPAVVPESGGLLRTTGIQPGVFYTLEAGPYLRILCLYSNVLEDPGVIADDHIGDSQLQYLNYALDRVVRENYEGALILAHHHPTYAISTRHGWSHNMAKQIDKVCKNIGVWPHAVLSGHSHSYQRFTRQRAAGQEIPYIVCGNSGHELTRIHHGVALRTPFPLDVGGKDVVTCENYDDRDYGYLRLVVTKDRLRIEFHPCSDGRDAKTPDDRVTIDLKTHKLVHA